MSKPSGIAKLLGLATASLAGEPDRRPGLLTGARGDELWSLLRQHNGFYAFESALHVFPASGAGPRTLEGWNAADLWRGTYQDLADGCVFFAEDVFGGQFVIRHDAIHTFDPETGETELIAPTLEGWARAILGEYELLTGQPLAHAWQAEHGALPEGKRLLPKIPFTAGGAFELANLYAADAVEGMRFRGDLAIQLRDVPDGGQIELRVVD